MKIIIWDLPQQEIEYIKRNCEKQFATEEISVMTPETAAKIYAQIEHGELSAEEVLLISEDTEILTEAVRSGMIAVAYQPPKQIEDIYSLSEQALPSVAMVVEGFEEADYDFFEKIYQRYHGLPWTIFETARLRVRELELSDMDALFELYSYEGMTDYMEGLYSYEEEYEYQKAYIENMYGFFGYGMWLVFEKESGKLIGRAGVEHREELEGEPELGYAIGTPWQGRGYATEVCQGILHYIKEELGFTKVCSLVSPKNTVSVHLLEKLGFGMEKELELEGVCYKKYQKTL